MCVCLPVFQQFVMCVILYVCGFKFVRVRVCLPPTPPPLTHPTPTPYCVVDIFYKCLILWLCWVLLFRFDLIVFLLLLCGCFCWLSPRRLIPTRVTHVPKNFFGIVGLPLVKRAQRALKEITVLDCKGTTLITGTSRARHTSVQRIVWILIDLLHV